MPLGERLQAAFERARTFGTIPWCATAALATLVIGVALALLLPPSRLQRIGAIDTGTSFDIPIFRCAARIVGNGDPYTIEPLATCEREQPKIFAGLIAPAPQPPHPRPPLPP